MKGHRGFGAHKGRGLFLLLRREWQGKGWKARKQKEQVIHRAGGQLGLNGRLHSGCGHSQAKRVKIVQQEGGQTTQLQIWSRNPSFLLFDMYEQIYFVRSMYVDYNRWKQCVWKVKECFPQEKSEVRSSRV